MIPQKRTPSKEDSERVLDFLQKKTKGRFTVAFRIYYTLLRNPTPLCSENIGNKNTSLSENGKTIDRGNVSSCIKVMERSGLIMEVGTEISESSQKPVPIYDVNPNPPAILKWKKADSWWLIVPPHVDNDTRAFFAFKTSTHKKVDVERKPEAFGCKVIRVAGSDTEKNHK